MRDRLLAIAILVVVSVVVLEILLVLPRPAALLIVAVGAWMALPGIVFVRHALAGGSAGRTTP